jgi:hypothetical protein
MVMMERRRVVHIRVTRAGVVVSHAAIGFLRRQLYRSHSLEEAASFAATLQTANNHQLTPPGMNDPILRAFTKVALSCSTVAELYEVLNAARDTAELRAAPAVG